MIDVRCPSCRRLLGKGRTDGTVEIRRGGKLQAIIRWGAVNCQVCGVEIEISLPHPARKDVFVETPR